MDAPPTEAPQLPAAVPATVAAAGRDPQRRSARAARSVAVRNLANQRHEVLGECGKMEIDRAVRAAADQLTALPRAALYPPRTATPDRTRTARFDRNVRSKRVQRTQSRQQS
jgi:hypothetical protein